MTRSRSSGIRSKDSHWRRVRPVPSMSIVDRSWPILESRRLVGHLAHDALAGVTIDCLGGLEIGAISIATTISDYGYGTTPRREWRTFVVRKQAKDHGLGKLIEGGVRSGDRALIVDDVLTSGGSLLKAVAAARGAGLTVTHALVIVDRKEQDGRRTVEAEGLVLVSLLTIDDLTRAQPTQSSRKRKSSQLRDRGARKARPEARSSRSEVHETFEPSHHHPSRSVVLREDSPVVPLD